MQPRIESLPEKKLIGQKMKMSLSENKTAELWRSFMPRIKKITNNVGIELYSVEVYGSRFFEQFDPNIEFEKWAAVEVTDFSMIPNEMAEIILPGGLYAIFLYKGPASGAFKMYEYIFGTWLPVSDFLVDDRPHFAVMGDKYKNEDPGSEEELCIPIKPRLNTE
jgi:AraC family transcriptional regulator